MTSKNQDSQSPASRLKHALCRWSCGRWYIEELDDWLSVEVGVSSADGDPLHCYVRLPTERTAGEVSDWGELSSALYLHGIHSSKLIQQRAATFGLRKEEHGILTREVLTEFEVMLAISAFQQLAAIAAAEQDMVSFSPPSMVLHAAWANVVSSTLSQKRQATVVPDYPGDLAPRPVGRHTIVALHEKEPIFASPYMRVDSPSWYHSLYYLLNEAFPAVKAVVPLLRVKDRSVITSSDRSELERFARTKGRHLGFVIAESRDLSFNPEENDYPAMRTLQGSSHILLEAYDEAQRRVSD